MFARVLSRVLAFGACIFPLSAHANDTSVGGTGVDLYSVKESAVRMKAEDITLTHHAGSWKIVAEYTFENPTKEDVQLQVGFPEVGCPKDDEGDCHAKPFVGLETEVDGKPVKHRKGSLKQTERWAENLGTFWLFDVTFSANETTRIVHRYSMDATVNSMGGVSAMYVTRTGSTWAGPIGEATFRFRVPPYATYLSANETLGAPKDPKFVREGSSAYTEVVFRKKNWVPSGDLDFQFATAFGQFPTPRLESDTLLQRAKGLGLEAADQCPWTGSFGQPPPTTAAQAQSCRNLVYARWGFPFKTKALLDLYYEGGRTWQVSETYGPRSLERDPEPLPSFSMAWTSDAERIRLRDIPFPKGEGNPAVEPQAPAHETAQSPATKSENPSKQSSAATNPKQSAAPPAKAESSSLFGCSWGAPAPADRSWDLFVVALVVALGSTVVLGRSRLVLDRSGRSG